jgi:hypothetical protein
MAPTASAVASASAGDDPALDKSEAKGSLVEPKLNVVNTLIKTVLDQTLGGIYNTFAFSTFMHGIKAAMAHQPQAASQSLAFLLSGKAFDPTAVDWQLVLALTRAEFWSIFSAGLTFWPFVSLINFTLVKTIETRNLVGSLAGMAWGVYMSLITA